MVLILSVLIGITYLELTGAKPAVKYYASKYDHIDVQAILNNRRMVNYYSSCLLNLGPCPPEGVEFKRILPEALHTNCGRCTEKQATVALRAIRRLRKEYPKVWSQLSERWDPDDLYVRKFEATFGSKSLNDVKNTLNDDNDDQPTHISLAESLPPIQPNSLNVPEPTTQTVTTASTNSLPSSTTTKPSTAPSYFSSSSSPTVTTSTSSITTSTSSATTSTSSTTPRILRPIPGLLPINTFFTNPPIPIRPINLNIGANIGATVKAIKQVEKVVTGIAREKLGMIRNIFVIPPLWRGARRKFGHFK